MPKKCKSNKVHVQYFRDVSLIKSSMRNYCFLSRYEVSNNALVFDLVYNRNKTCVIMKCQFNQHWMTLNW